MCMAGLRKHRVLRLLLVVLALVAPVSQAAMLCCGPSGGPSMAHAEMAADPGGAAIDAVENCHEDAQLPKDSFAEADAAAGLAMDADCLSDCLDILQLSVPEQEFAQELEAHTPSLRPTLVPHILPAHGLPLLRPPAV